MSSKTHTHTHTAISQMTVKHLPPANAKQEENNAVKVASRSKAPRGSASFFPFFFSSLPPLLTAIRPGRAAFASGRCARTSLCADSMTGSRSVQCLALLLLTAVLLQTVAVAVTFIYFNSVLTTMKETFSRSSIACLMRSNLRTVKGLDGSVQDAQDTQDGKDDPCWQVTQQLHFLVEKTTSTRHKKEITSAVKDEVARVLPSLARDRDPPSRPEIAAHVTGTSMTETDHVEESLSARKVPGQKILSWEKERGLAFLRNVQMSDGELEVPKAGLYYIYSQTYFRVSGVLEDDDDGDEVEDVAENQNRGKQMLQYIYKKVTSYPVPILLMKNARTTCWARNAEYGLYSIYQAGVFQLGAGDRIFVSVSDVSTLGMDEKSSFFGAFLLT
ncbi:tumor necrosis factor ligand superfamily member 10-like isoform X2 [Scleropages formosus]|uniref:tumor necrosis factor ligand superfamily member 10-like isoform X2 n=1 Tax=Scleropages formosus TaxID=113540 RepID=UPI0010FA69E1|nr:tumor necrosis factor ligand superfamily member 10-like isoform X2 [Scleropages formosus]